MGTIEIDGVLNGLTYYSVDGVSAGNIIASKTTSIAGTLRGFTSGTVGISGVVKGSNNISLDGILLPKEELSIGGILLARDYINAIYSFIENDISNFHVSSTLSLTNMVTVNYAFNQVTNQYDRAVTRKNPISEYMYGLFPGTVNLQMIHKSRQASIIADAFLQMYAFPTVKVSFEHNLTSLYVQEGDTVLLTHRGGIGEYGFIETPGIVIRKSIRDAIIGYTTVVDVSLRNWHKTELVNTFETYSVTGGAIMVTYENGIATLTVYADIANKPPIEGASISIDGVIKLTDLKGQAKFYLERGTYTAYITASGYENAEVTFTV